MPDIGGAARRDILVEATIAPVYRRFGWRLSLFRADEGPLRQGGKKIWRQLWKSMVKGAAFQDVCCGFGVRLRAVEPLTVGQNVRMLPSLLHIEGRRVGRKGGEACFTAAPLDSGRQQLVRKRRRRHAATDRMALRPPAATCIDTSGSKSPTSSKLEASIISRPL